MFRYIIDHMSLNNSRLGDYVDDIYLIELEINDTTDAACPVSYLVLSQDIDREYQWRTKLYDKRDDLNFQIVKVSFMQCM